MASEIHVSCAGKWQVCQYRMEENICPTFYFRPSILVFAGKFKTGQSQMSQIIFLLTQLFQEEAKPFVSVEGQ